MGQWIGQSTLLGHVSALGQSFWIIPLNDLGFFFFLYNSNLKPYLKPVCLFRIIFEIIFYFFFKINHILFNFFKFYPTKSNLIIRAMNSNNIRIQHPNGPLLRPLSLCAASLSTLMQWQHRVAAQ
jgi:hypothetical protein